MTRHNVRFLVPGDVSAEVSVLSAPLSLWGGYDVHSGTIVDVTHPQRGMSLAGRVVAMREARGSSSSSSALVEAARSGTAPAAIILTRLDPILVIGGLIAADLYGVAIPVVLLAVDQWAFLRSGTTVRTATDTSELIVED